MLTKTVSISALEGDPRYCSYVQRRDKICPRGWHQLWGSLDRNVRACRRHGAPGPEHIKQLIVHIFKTLERAVLSCKTLSHTEVDLAASPDAIWDVYKHVDEWLPKYFPEFLLSSTFLKGHGEVGSIRVVKIGPGTKFSLAGFSQVAILHMTNYSRNTV